MEGVRKFDCGIDVKPVGMPVEGRAELDFSFGMGLFSAQDIPDIGQIAGIDADFLEDERNLFVRGPVAALGDLLDHKVIHERDILDVAADYERFVFLQHFDGVAFFGNGKVLVQNRHRVGEVDFIVTVKSRGDDDPVGKGRGNVHRNQVGRSAVNQGVRSVVYRREKNRHGEGRLKDRIEIAFGQPDLPVGFQIVADDDDRNGQILEVEVSEDIIEDIHEPGIIQNSAFQGEHWLENFVHWRGDDQFLDLVGGQAGGVQQTDNRAHRVGDDEIGFDTGFLEPAEHADMGIGPGGAAGKKQAERRLIG